MEIIKRKKKINSNLLGLKRKDVLFALKNNDSQIKTTKSGNELFDFIEPTGPFVYYDYNEIVNAIEIASNTDIEILMANMNLFDLQYNKVVSELIKISSDYEIEDSYHSVFYDIGIGVANDSDGNKPTSLIIFNDKYYKR